MSKTDDDDQDTIMTN